MAFDDVPGSDPRGPTCPKCREIILPHQPSTLMHLPNGSQPWHGECARPYWDKMTPMLDRLRFRRS